MKRAVRTSVARGTVIAPPSKSYTHRALVAGYLTGRRYRIDRPLRADDTRATARGLAALGGSFQEGPTAWTWVPRHDKDRDARTARIECRESGTTLRFLSALAATLDRSVRFTGRPGLARRPLGELLEVLRSGGVTIEGLAPGRSLPFWMHGPLRPVNATLDTSTSSQFLSALLLVLPTLGGPSDLRLSGDPVSWDYVEATLAILRHHRVDAEVNRTRARVPGGQHYRGTSFAVPGDASSAAYAWAAAALTGGAVRVRGIPRQWPQADLALLDYLETMGATVRRHADGATVEGGPLAATEVDLGSSPDLYPLVGVLASFARGTTRIRGAPHVAWKESDRRAATVRLARGFGAGAGVVPGGVDIRGTAHPRAIHVQGIDDHRVVMSASVGAMAAPGESLIGDAACVRKSFPGYWGWASSLGMTTEVRR